MELSLMQQQDGGEENTLLSCYRILKTLRKLVDFARCQMTAEP